MINPISSAFEFFLAFLFNLPLSVQSFISLSFLLWVISSVFTLLHKIRS